MNLVHITYFNNYRNKLNISQDIDLYVFMNVIRKMVSFDDLLLDYFREQSSNE